MSPAAPTRAPLCSCQNTQGKGGTQEGARKQREITDTAVELLEVKMHQQQEGEKTEVFNEIKQTKERAHSVRLK